MQDQFWKPGTSNLWRAEEKREQISWFHWYYLHKGYEIVFFVETPTFHFINFWCSEIHPLNPVSLQGTNEETFSQGIMRRSISLALLQIRKLPLTFLHLNIRMNWSRCSKVFFIYTYLYSISSFNTASWISQYVHSQQVYTFRQDRPRKREMKCTRSSGRWLPSSMQIYYHKDCPCSFQAQ